FCFSSRRRHTRSKRDWSSDVCSSDLAPSATLAKVTAMSSSHGTEVGVAALRHHQPSRARTMLTIGPTMEMTKLVVAALSRGLSKIGRASCRERGWVWVVARRLEERQG